ncbi:MAG TPA: hypothetical protein VGM82_18860 [Gemmatimonadaceae bacterium]|jgi:hypothetical protein
MSKVDTKPRARRRKSATIEESGVRVRVFKRGTRYWLDVHHGDRRERVSANTIERSVAEDNARELARAIAKRYLLGVRTDEITVGQLFAAYNEHKGKTLEGAWKKASVAHQRDFLAAWGESLPVVSVSQSNVDAYSATRRAAFLLVQTTSHAARTEKRRQMIERHAQTRQGRPPRAEASAPPFVPRPLRDGALDCDFRWLSSVCNWATRHKLADGRRLLTSNPLHDCKWPKEQNVRRPVASHDRYERTLAEASAIDATGRLALVLTLARYTARRIDAILQLSASDFLLSTERIRAALANAGQNEQLADAMTHGAIRWRMEHDKQGTERITPVTKLVRDAIDGYLRANPRVGEVPAFPAVEDEKRPLSRSSATKWLRVAEQRAELPKLRGSLWHAYRRLWATERKSLPDVDVAEAGGWNGTKAMKLAYQHATPAGVLAAVMNAG